MTASLNRKLAGFVCLLITTLCAFGQSLPIAEPGSVNVTENTPTSFLIVGTNSGGNSLSFLIVEQPIHGSVSFFGQSGNSETILYTPNSYYFGTDNFSFAVSNAAGKSLPATVSLTVAQAPMPPVANNDEYSVALNAPLTVTSELGVLDNDFDPTGEALTAYLVNAATNGIVTLNPDGSFIYSPNTGFAGYDQFTYAVSNASLASGSATVTLDVGNERWDGQFDPSGFAEQVSAISVATNGDVYAGGAMTRSRSYGGIARWDGRIWHPLGNSPFNGVNGIVNALAWQNGALLVGGNFTEAGGRPAFSMARWDGAAWSGIPGGVHGQVQALAVSSNGFYAGGQFNGAGSQRLNNITFWDGTNWNDLAGGVAGAVDALAESTNGDVYVGGAITSAGGFVLKSIALWSGGAWSTLGAGLSGTVNALLLKDGQLYAGGGFTNSGSVSLNHIGYWDGAQWRALGNGLPGGPVTSLLFTDGQLCAGQATTQSGSSTSTQVSKWDGTNWTALPQSLSAQYYSSVLALAARNGNLLAGGDFTAAGSAVVDYTASWDGQKWSALNNALIGNDAYSVSVQGSNVYLGGDFTAAAGTPVNKIVRWDGANWWPMGSGMNNTVFAIAGASSGPVYAGGQFTQAGGVTASNIAEWIGTNWNSLGIGASNGVNGTVHALLVNPDGTLIAGGSFHQAGGIAATNIAEWNGQNWSSLGVGVNGNVLALASSGTDLYVGGSFNQAGGAAVNNVAYWDGVKWNAMGKGLGSSAPQVVVQALAVRGPEVFAGCEVSTTGPEPLPYVARWDGATWTYIASSLTMPGHIVSIQALQVIGSDLYAGGLFTAINTLETYSLARWDGTNWFPLGTGIQGNDPSVYSLASQGNELLVAGSFGVAGNKPSTLFARWALSDSPPTVQIVSPVSGSVFTVGTNINLGVTTSDASGSISEVSYYAGTNLIGASSEAPFSLTWNNVFTGNYLVYAYATDSAGQTTISAPVQIIVAPPAGDVPPDVSVVSPSNGAVLPTGQYISIGAGASASQGSIRQVAFYENGNLLGLATNSPYSITWSNAVAGQFTISAVAMDNFGATNAASVQVTFDDPPTVYVDEPLEGQVYDAPTLVILEANANNADGTIARVDFYTNGVFFITATLATSPEYSYRWNNAPVGDYSITALAVDQHGFSALSVPVHFSVIASNSLPTISITSPAPGAAYSAPTSIVVTVDITAAAGVASVRLYADTALWATLTNSPFTFVMRNLSQTTYCLSVQVTDKRGQMGNSGQVCVTVTNDPTRMPQYNIIDLGALLGPQSFAEGLNSNGVVVGGTTSATASERPIIYSNGVVQTLPLFPGGAGLGGSGQAMAINNAGAVTGNAADGSGYGHAFLYQPDSTMLNLGTLGGNQSWGNAINTAGEIVGIADDSNNNARAFLYANGKMTNLDNFGGGSSAATAINSAGQVVGFAYLPTAGIEGFLYAPGVGYKSLGDLGGGVCQPHAINDAGEIAGDSGTPDGYAHAFLSLDGFMVDLGTLGGFSSAALGMNGYGEIVGWSDDVNLNAHAILWQNYVMYDLNDLIPPGSGWVLQSANAINDAGEIVGTGLYGADQNSRAFILTLSTNSPQTPQDSHLTSYSAGQFNLSLPVPLGVPFVLEASTNFTDWIPLTTNYDRSGLLNFLDSQAGKFSARFYRAAPLAP